MVSINAFMSGDNLKITAFARAGKTSILVQIADLREGAGLYLAFNQAIADEAKYVDGMQSSCRSAFKPNMVEGRSLVGRDGLAPFEP